MIQTLSFIHLNTTGSEWKIKKMQYKTRKGMWLEVIFSKHQRKQIMEFCLSDPTAGHLGRTQTFYKVSERSFLLAWNLQGCEENSIYTLH